MPILTGKNAVVTGASWGIGRAIAIGLGREGCNVLVTARRKEWLDETAKRIRSDGSSAKPVVCDIGRIDDIKALAAVASREFAPLDILVNVAFGDLETPLLDSGDADLQDFINVSVSGTMLVTKYLLRLLNEEMGHIVNIVADWGLPMHNILTDALTPYIAAKHAIAGFTSSLRRELGLLGKTRIMVTGIFPGVTASVDPEENTSLDIDDPIDQSGNMVSLRDFARAVIFVLSLETTCVPHLVLSPASNLYDGSESSLNL